MTHHIHAIQVTLTEAEARATSHALGLALAMVSGNNLGASIALGMLKSMDADTPLISAGGKLTRGLGDPYPSGG